MSVRWYKDNLDKENLNEVAVRAQAGDADALRDLTERMRPIVVNRTNKVNPSYYSEDIRDDLDQAAWVGVWHALDTFDPDAGTKFSTWAWPYIQHEIGRWLASNTGAVPLPKLSWQYAARLEEIWDEQNPGRTIHEASDEELAALEIPVKRKGEETTITVPYAGDILRARVDAKGIKLDSGLVSTPHASAEDDWFDENFEEPVLVKRRGATPKDEQRVLRFVDSLEDVMFEEWPSVVEDFCDEHGLDYDVVWTAVMLYTGGPS